MQPLQNCISSTIRISRDILCLPYAGFLCQLMYVKKNVMPTPPLPTHLVTQVYGIRPYQMYLLVECLVPQMAM